MPKKTLVTAKEAGNEIIVQVKENQKKLLEACEKVAQETVPVEISNRPESRKESEGAKKDQGV